MKKYILYFIFSASCSLLFPGKVFPGNIFPGNNNMKFAQTEITSTGNTQSPFMLSPHLLSSLTPYQEETITTQKNLDIPFLYITFTYILPVSYATLSILCKENYYSSSPEDNPFYYTNPVLTSVLFFGSGGFFGGMAIGVIASMNDGFFESFVYGTVLGILLGITGMIVGGIYALIEEDTITNNDLFYYGAPVIIMLTPVIDILSIIFIE
jgi:hypothetical protein